MVNALIKFHTHTHTHTAKSRAKLASGFFFTCLAEGKV